MSFAVIDLFQSVQIHIHRSQQLILLQKGFKELYSVSAGIGPCQTVSLCHPGHLFLPEQFSGFCLLHLPVSLFQILLPHNEIIMAHK